jgi:hypothetical protein
MLSLDDRAAGIAALYRFDDAMRGFGQTVIWDLAAPTLWRLQQQMGGVKWVAVRESGCIHSRLLGFCIHELIHAMCGAELGHAGRAAVRRAGVGGAG